MNPEYYGYSQFTIKCTPRTIQTLSIESHSNTGTVHFNIILCPLTGTGWTDSEWLTRVYSHKLQMVATTLLFCWYAKLQTFPVAIYIQLYVSYWLGELPLWLKLGTRIRNCALSRLQNSNYCLTMESPAADINPIVWSVQHVFPPLYGLSSFMCLQCVVIPCGYKVVSDKLPERWEQVI